MTTYILYPPFSAIGDTYNSVLNPFIRDKGPDAYSDALTMLSLYLEATAGDLRSLAKTFKKHDISVSGDEHALIVSGPEEILAEIKLESCDFTKFDSRKSGVIVNKA